MLASVTENARLKRRSLVNRERLRFYLLLGRDIVEMKAESRWGSGFYDTLSRDIRSMLSDATGFSARNLRYMVKFYAMYGSILNLPQAATNLENNPEEPNLPQVAAKIDEEELFSVPWGHQSGKTSLMESLNMVQYKSNQKKAGGKS